MRTVRLFVALIPALILTGCLQSTALVKVNADGSGTIDHRTVMTTEAIAQMRQLSGLFGGGSGKPVDPFSEADARDMATKMGDGVTLVSSAPIQTPGGEGRGNVYGFRDITKLSFNGTPAAGNTSVRAGGLGIGGSDVGTVTFDLARTANGNVLLTLHSPTDLFDSFVGRAAAAGGGGTPNGLEQLLMVRQMVAGIRLAIRVEPAGRLVRTSSPYVDGSTVTLFDLDLDALLKNDSAFTRLQTAKTKEEGAAILKEVPGFAVNLDRDVTIEFAP